MLVTGIFQRGQWGCWWSMMDSNNNNNNNSFYLYALTGTCILAHKTLLSLIWIIIYRIIYLFRGNIHPITLVWQTNGWRCSLTQEQIRDSKQPQHCICLFMIQNIVCWKGPHICPRLQCSCRLEATSCCHDHYLMHACSSIIAHYSKVPLKPSCEPTDVDKMIGTLPLKKEKPTLVTEITWNCQSNNK